MTEKVTKLMKDVPAIRWTALVFLAFAMFCAYIFMDILSPVKSILETTRGWDSEAFGFYAGSETFLNVFIFFLIFAGIILDKMGVRFTAILSGLVMIVGALINWYSVTEMFMGTGLETWFNNNLNYIPGFDEIGVSPFYRGMPASAKLASVGFMVFGCGVEMAGITVSRGIVKWFKGKEMALAMGSEMALARLGVATCMIFSPLIAKANIFGGANVSHAVAFGVILLMIALIMFIAYFFMDKKLDAQLGETEEKDDPFKVSDIGKIFASGGFWLVALLCVLYYSAIFPFQKYAVNMLECNLTFTTLPEGSFWGTPTAAVVGYLLMLIVAATSFISNFCKTRSKIALLSIAVVFLVVFCVMSYKQQSAGAIFAVFPLLAVGITPILGNYIDKKGKAATMLMLGSMLLIICHLTFAFILPLFKGQEIGGVVLAFSTILVLGASFSLVPASLWPSVPKLVDQKVIGSAFALIFWIQNIGLWLFPLLIGKILKASNTDIVAKVDAGILTSQEAAVSYNYTNPLIMLACLGAVALVLGFVLKRWDKKKGIGLELPNIKS
ncbi:MAG: MFS transporter [Lentimicrobiaceae bacterium]|nr:MFS transporter [Lentimicrobiaceae bacterium]